MTRGRFAPLGPPAITFRLLSWCFSKYGYNFFFWTLPREVLAAPWPGTWRVVTDSAEGARLHVHQPVNGTATSVTVRCASVSGKNPPDARSHICSAHAMCSLYRVHGNVTRWTSASPDRFEGLRSPIHPIERRYSRCPWKSKQTRWVLNFYEKRTSGLRGMKADLR